MFFILYIYIMMEKPENKQELGNETKFIITLKWDDVVVELHWEKGGEKDFADYLVEGVIPTFSRIMDWMDVTDDLKFNIFIKWMKQITKRLWDLDVK